MENDGASALTAGGLDRLARVARAARLREGPEGVATLIRAVVRHGPITLREAARRAGLPLPVATAVRRELEKEDVLARGPRLVLSAAGRHFVERELGLSARLDPTCPTCEGRGVVRGPELAEAFGRFRAHVALNPVNDVTLDQAPCTPETAFDRALMMHGAGAIEGRAVLLLGDDDQVSVAIALLGQAIGLAPFARRLAVLEIDPRRIERIADIARRDSLAIECIRHDLRDPLPEALRARFDCFATDPPYTMEGAGLFLARGIEALEPRPGLSAFLSFAELAPDDALELERCHVALGLSAARILPGFNRYEGASVLGGRGQLIQLRTTRATASPLAGTHVAGPIYTGEIRGKARRYRCAACGLEVPVGRGQAALTIEALKAEGCPGCGHDRFRLLGRTDLARPVS